MAVLFFDSFQHYASVPITTKWNTEFGLNGPYGGGPVISSAAGRGGLGLALSHGAVVTKSLPDTNPLIVQFSFRPTVIANRRICFFRSEGEIQSYLQLSSAGKINVCRGDGTILGVSGNSLIANDYVYIRFRITTSNTVGAFTLYVGNTLEATASSIDTQFSTTTSNITNFGLGDAANNSAVFHYDDILILDTTGSKNNDIINPFLVDCIFPRANGDVQAYSVVGAASHYLGVNDTSPDDDTSHILRIPGGGTSELFYFDKIRNTQGGIIAVAHHTYARKEFGNTSYFQSASRPGTFDGVMGGSTTYVANQKHYLQAEYAFHSEYYEDHPATGGTFSVPGINATQWGFQ